MTVCSICGGLHYGKGLCKSHYMKAYVRKSKPVLSEAAKANMRAAKLTPEYRARANELRRARYATDAEYREIMKARATATHAANPEPGLARATAQRETPEYKAYQVAYNCVRRTRLKQSTPPWADKKAIRAFYARARESGLEVDHIIPISGDLVSGLHAPNNLQMLSRSENARKNNRFDPEAACQSTTN